MTATSRVAGARTAVALDFSVISPLGSDAGSVLRSLSADHRAGTSITRFDASALPVDTAAQVNDSLDHLLGGWDDSVREAARFDRKLELGLACAASGFDRFGSLMEGVPPERRGLVMGVGLDVSPLERISTALAGFDLADSRLDVVGNLNRRVEGMGAMFNPSDLGAVLLADLFDCAAFQETILTACSSSSQAIGLGLEAIRRDQADVVVVGGTDSLINLPAFAAFTKLGVIQPSQSDPAGACRPFDRHRRGTLLGEGAGMILLSSAAHADRIGADAEIEVVGFGNTLDGHHITAPDPTGLGMERAMVAALQDAGVGPDAIDYVNMHGTGTRANDPVELAALCRVLGAAAPDVMTSSTKDRHGHLIAAAGVMEAIVVMTCMKHSLVPRTVNLNDPIVSDGIDLVRDRNRQATLNTCMSNSFAFGGVNTSIIFRRRC